MRCAALAHGRSGRGGVVQPPLPRPGPRALPCNSCSEGQDRGAAQNAGSCPARCVPVHRLGPAAARLPSAATRDPHLQLASCARAPHVSGRRCPFSPSPRCLAFTALPRPHRSSSPSPPSFARAALAGARTPRRVILSPLTPPLDPRRRFRRWPLNRPPPRSNTAPGLSLAPAPFPSPTSRPAFTLRAARLPHGCSLDVMPPAQVAVQ